MAASYVDLDPALHAALEALRGASASEATTRQNGTGPAWTVPGEAPLDVLDDAGIAERFSRAQVNSMLMSGLTSPSAPGNVGDMIAAQQQMDLLATMERAFRARHQSGWPRALALASGRKRGHGQPLGPLMAMENYVRGIINAAKAKETP